MTFAMSVMIISPSAAAGCRAPSATSQTETSCCRRSSLKWDLLKRLTWLDTRLRHALRNQTLPGVSLQFGTAAVCQCGADWWPPREEKKGGKKGTLDTDVEVFPMDAVRDAWGRGGSLKKTTKKRRWIKGWGDTEPKGGRRGGGERKTNERGKSGEIDDTLSSDEVTRAVEVRGE